MTYMALPPEVNSARIESGPGAESLVAAANSWRSLAMGYEDAVAQYSSVVSGVLATWQGPSAAAFQDTAAQQISWMHTAAAVALHNSEMADQAAEAYAAVRISMVPTTMIAANRTTLLNLIATNLFGQNAAAIATTEMQYQEMWLQDATAMSAYQTQSTAATSTLSAPAADPAATDPSGPLATLNSLFSYINNSNDVFGPNANFWNTVFTGGLNPATLAPVLGQLQEAQRSNDLTERGNAISQALENDDEMQLGLTPRTFGPPIINPAEAPTFPENYPHVPERAPLGGGTAHTASAVKVGGLSVPPKWTAGQVKTVSAAEPMDPSRVGMPVLPFIPTMNLGKDKSPIEQRRERKLGVPIFGVKPPDGD